MARQFLLTLLCAGALTACGAVAPDEDDMVAVDNNGDDAAEVQAEEIEADDEDEAEEEPEPERFEVPDVVGDDLDDAQAYLEAHDFNVRTVFRASDEFPENAVVEQSPRAGVTKDAGSTIILTVAEEPEEEAEPDDEGDPDVVVRIERIYEPDEAWSAISEVNQFNDPPRDGHAFWMLLIEVTNHTDDTLEPWDFSWWAEGQDVVVYNEGCMAVLPSPELMDVAAIRPGGSQQGHICFEMREGDAHASGERMIGGSAYDEDFEELVLEFAEAEEEETEA